MFLPVASGETNWSILSSCYKTIEGLTTKLIGSKKKSKYLTKDVFVLGWAIPMNLQFECNFVWLKAEVYGHNKCDTSRQRESFIHRCIVK